METQIVRWEGDRKFAWVGWLGCVFSEHAYHPKGSTLYLAGELFYAYSSSKGGWLDKPTTDWVLADAEKSNMDFIRKFRDIFIDRT